MKLDGMTEEKPKSLIRKSASNTSTTSDKHTGTARRKKILMKPVCSFNITREKTPEVMQLKDRRIKEEEK